MMKVRSPWDDYVRRVVIQTANYLDFDGSYSAGGRQRHIRDLASVIREDWGRDVLIVQKGTHSFAKKCDHGFSVIGIKADLSAKGDPMFAFRVRQMVSTHDGLLYASGEDAWPFFLANSKAIQHGIWWDGPQSRITRFIQKWRVMACMRSVRSMLCVDTNFINWLRSQGSAGLAYCNKCEYIPNYADISLIEISRPQKTVPLRLICARRYEHKRGIHLFISALAIVKNRGIPFSAHISTNQGFEEIYNLLDKHRIYSETSVSNDDMDTVLKRYGDADIAVIPTIWSEGTSLACVEAICAGVPVVVTPVGGLGNLVIPGFNGLVANPTPESLAHAIELLLTDIELLGTMRRNCLSMRQSLAKDAWRKRILYWIKS
jgi:glycosyltransferase involved in cell wall biosynthesis